MKEGCRDALVLWGSTLVDGHHRYQICRKHNILFKTVEQEFASRDDAKEWIVRNQFGRRNLSPWDRCRLALKLEDVFREKAKDQHSLKHTALYKEEVMVQKSAPSPDFNNVSNKTRD